MSTSLCICSADPVQPESKNELPWRLGVLHPKSKQLLLRYATTADVKERNAAQKSKYYRKYNIFPVTNPVVRKRRKRDGHRFEGLEGEMQWEPQTRALVPLGGDEDLRYFCLAFYLTTFLLFLCTGDNYCVQLSVIRLLV